MPKTPDLFNDGLVTDATVVSNLHGRTSLDRYATGQDEAPCRENADLIEDSATTRTFLWERWD
jgi:hypothetical protein